VLCADFENCHLLRRLPVIICVLQISSEVRKTSKFSHMLVLEERNITSLGTCNIFLTMTVNAISPKYCSPRMSASAWPLPTGSKSSGREQYSLRFAASLGGKTEASSKEGQHECMLCNISFYLIPTLAKPMSRKYNVLPMDPLLMMVSPFENACT
jgi:hypothetical protein